jgi:hypothetical protein
MADSSAAAANAVDLPVERLILLFHLLDCFHGRVTARFRLSLRGKLGFLSLIASFALGLGLDGPAQFHGQSGRTDHCECNGCT